MRKRHKLLRSLLAVATALPVIGGVVWLISARKQVAYSSCIAHLQQIDGAKAMWALEHEKTSNDLATLQDLFGPDRYITQMPACPQGGTYTIGRVGEVVRCTIPMHSRYFGLVEVVDQNGIPVAGAYVTLEGTELSGDSTVTDPNGHALVSPFPAIVVDDWSRGQTTIMVSKVGYQPASATVPASWPVSITLKAATRDER